MYSRLVFIYFNHIRLLHKVVNLNIIKMGETIMKGTNKYFLNQTIDTSTGEIMAQQFLAKNEYAKPTKILSANQLNAINKKNKSNKEGSDHSKNLGGHINMSYIKNELLYNELNLDSANISRIIYLSTYVDYNNREGELFKNKLVYHGYRNKIEVMNKKDIKRILGLTDRTFDRFFKDVKENNLLIENEDGTFSLNEKYFCKGTIAKKDPYFKKGNYTRLYIDTTRKLYEGVKVSQHKPLADIFRLIPKLNYETNIISHENGKHMTFKEITEFLIGKNPSRQNVADVRKKLGMFEVEHEGVKYSLFGQVYVKVKCEDTSYFVVNPMVVYGGSNYDYVKDAVMKMVFDAVK